MRASTSRTQIRRSRDHGLEQVETFLDEPIEVPGQPIGATPLSLGRPGGLRGWSSHAWLRGAIDRDVASLRTFREAFIATARSSYCSEFWCSRQQAPLRGPKEPPTCGSSNVMLSTPDYGAARLHALPREREAALWECRTARSARSPAPLSPAALATVEIRPVGCWPSRYSGSAKQTDWIRVCPPEQNPCRLSLNSLVHSWLQTPTSRADRLS